MSKPQLTTSEIRQLATPTIFLVGLVVFGLLIWASQPNTSPEQWRITIWIGGFAIGYGIFMYMLIMPRLAKNPGLSWILAVFHGLAVPLLGVFIPFQPVSVILLISTTMLLFTTTVFGRGPAYLFILSNVFLEVVWVLPQTGYPMTQIEFTLITLAVAVGMAETSLLARQMLFSRIERLAIINGVANTLAVSIDQDQVLKLIKEVIQQALNADTYFVALLKDDQLSLELLYDKGEFFPRITTSNNFGIAGWVLEHKQTLRLDNVPAQLEGLGITRHVVGKDEINLSWMGTPLESGGHILGLVAVAAYRFNAFTEGDQMLLESVAHQASLVLDNAYHHADVEEQSRRDSLTGAYNHGYFLKLLAEMATKSQQERQTLSLIMLDVDHFKHYNDQYGHLVGDEVLRVLTATIQRFVKNTDAVGRWGGEEFVIALPNTQPDQASVVAERIRTTMATFTLLDRDSQPIPAPTVSQGIAIFPEETDDIYTLVDIADKRLYQAKDKGRNQICPVPNTGDLPAMISD